MRFRYFNVNKKVDQLDGNGCLYLALQDVSLKNGDYLRAIDNKIAQVKISQLKFYGIYTWYLLLMFRNAIFPRESIAT